METEKMENVFQFLNEKEIVKFLQLIHDAEKEYDEYQRKVNDIVRFFERLAYELSYDCENDREICEKYNKISKILDKIKELRDINMSPIYIITESLKIDEKID